MSASPYLVFLIGSLIGLIEIVSRHSDYRFAAAIKTPAIAYIALNGILCVVALWLINATEPAWLGFDQSHSAGDQVRIVLTAGFGASAFFRTSIFKLKTPDGELPIGPALISDRLLDLFDEAVDRAVGEKRLKDVADIMVGVSFAKAAINLPTLCFANLRRLTADRQADFAGELNALIGRMDVDEAVKNRNLGLMIMKLTGRGILQAAVADLGDTIRH